MPSIRQPTNWAFQGKVTHKLVLILPICNVFPLCSLLDAEDIDSARPDEKSILTYVASYYHTFARMKNEQKSGKRIANVSTHLEFQIN